MVSNDIMGTDYVYYSKSKKIIVIIEPSDVAEAESYFNDLGVKVVTGQLYLDGIVMVKKSLKSMWMKEFRHVCNVYKT